jgi:hypothetical protein
MTALQTERMSGAGPGQHRPAAQKQNVDAFQGAYTPQIVHQYA